MEPLLFSYDRVVDILTVEGIKYSGEFFRQLAVSGPSDQAFKIVQNSNGVIFLKKMEA